MVPRKKAPDGTHDSVCTTSPNELGTDVNVFTLSMTKGPVMKEDEKWTRRLLSNTSQYEDGEKQLGGMDELEEATSSE